MKKYFNSIKRKVIFSDLLIVSPLIILFFVLFSFIFRDSNQSVNDSRMAVLDERCSNIVSNNDEIIQIINAISVNIEINRVVSQREVLSDYPYIKNIRFIRNKMLEITEMFSSKHYGLMLLCNNGENYYQNSLNVPKDAVSIEKIAQEEWYQEMMKKNSTRICFLPGYRSAVLQSYFPEDTVFAVQHLRNLNSGRDVGILILSVSQSIWRGDVKDSPTNRSIIIDEFGKVISPVESELYGADITTFDFYDVIKSQEKGFLRDYIGEGNANIYFMSIDRTGWKLVLYEPYRQTWSVYLIWLGILTVTAFSVIAFMVIFNCSFVNRRMKAINKNIVEVSSGNLQTRIRENYEVEFHEMCSSFNTMLDQLEELVSQLEQKEQEKYALEFRSLQSQINSHFFNNTLATIRFMIQTGEYQDADRTLIAFSRLLRKSFADSRRITSVTEELETVEEYIELMSLRYQGQFLWNISAQIDADRTGILKNTIQPMVENSISHGFHMKEDIGHIDIRVQQVDTYIIVEVEDDGMGADLGKINACIHSEDMPKPKEKFSEIGLSNIQMRIIKNFGSEFGLTARINEKGGVTLNMKIPMIDLSKKEEIS